MNSERILGLKSHIQMASILQLFAKLIGSNPVSMKASLLIDRLVDLSLNYQYKIVTKKRLLVYSFFCGISQ
jgi:hypothetical protein